MSYVHHHYTEPYSIILSPFLIALVLLRTFIPVIFYRCRVRVAVNFKLYQLQIERFLVRSDRVNFRHGPAPFGGNPRLWYRRRRRSGRRARPLRHGALRPDAMTGVPDLPNPLTTRQVKSASTPMTN